METSSGRFINLDVSMTVGNSKVMKCSRHANMGQMHVRLNSEPLEELDCFKYFGSQVATDEIFIWLWYSE